MTTALTDRVIADAKSLPELIARAQLADPALAQSLTSKALVQSKTVWGTALTMILTWAVARYGLAWSPDFCALVAGLLTMSTTVILRAVTRSPIGGVLSSAPAAAAVPPVVKTMLALALIVPLVACGQQIAGVQTMPTPQTPDQALFEAQTDFELALHQATVLPLCSTAQTTACLTGQQMGMIYGYASDGVGALNAAKSAVAVYDAAPTVTAQQKALAAVATFAVVAPKIAALLPKGA